MHKKIQNLNEAFAHFSNALKLIEESWDKPTPDIETYLWRIKKNIDNLNRAIMKELMTVEQVGEEFKKIVEQWKKQFDK